MPYVRRDSEGRVAAVFAEPQADADEFLGPGAEELRAFVGDPDDGGGARQTLTASDLELVRVLEDLIAVLLDKNIIQPTDLPAEARAKLLKRRQLRGELEALVGLVAEDDGDQPL
jgi:hypothetical protein